MDAREVLTLLERSATVYTADGDAEFMIVPRAVYGRVKDALRDAARVPDAGATPHPDPLPSEGRGNGLAGAPGNAGVNS